MKVSIMFYSLFCLHAQPDTICLHDTSMHYLPDIFLLLQLDAPPPPDVPPRPDIPPLPVGIAEHLRLPVDGELLCAI